MHQHSPSVTQLQLHLPEMQMVRFNPDQETADNIIRHKDIHKTTLNAFFNLCRAQPELTQDLLYPDCPSKFTWNLKSKAWNLWKNNHEMIGRVTFCPPSAGERYYLHMLLYAFKGPTSFEDLKNYNGEVLPMFMTLIITTSYILHFNLHVLPEDSWKETMNGISASRKLD